jgi:hypothetical protein
MHSFLWMSTDESKLSETAREMIADLADAAFQRMAAKVLERARQTGTPVVVWKDDRVTELPAEQIAENRNPKTENQER